MNSAEQKAPAFLSTTRLRPSSIPGRSAFEESLSDKARIVASTAFRRLQTKAQVFSLERNAAVRSRLTHTLEVAMYGQLIASKVADQLSQDGLWSQDSRNQLVTCVENACLLHDIGNPPFGHLGEFAIRTWFRSNDHTLLDAWRSQGVPPEQSENYRTAYKEFDGNPQGFRIVTLLQWLKDPYGLNLTCSLLAAMVKYPHGQSGTGAFAKKLGYFPSEAGVKMRVWEESGLRQGQRHPLAFIMEAADDIAYCLSDIEDAIEKRIITEEQFFKAIEHSGAARFDTLRAKGPVSSTARFVDFRVALTRHLVNDAVKTFTDRYDDILSGRLDKALLDCDADCNETLDALKGYARQHIFVSREAVNIELGGYHIVQDLLDRFLELLLLPRREFSAVLPRSGQKIKHGELALPVRLASLLPGRQLLAYQNAVAAMPDLEAVFRTQVIVDYVSGMTDSHALQVHRVLRGASDGVQP